MSIETEIKIQLGEIESIRRRLKTINAVRLSERHFEDNYLLDFPDGRLRAQRCLLRVRYTKNAGFVTFKGPPEPGTPFKIREELETRVDDASAALRVFESLGLMVWFRYQKYREEYELAAHETKGATIHLALDETPIGDYAELEGLQEGIREKAAAMGFSESDFLCDSYYGLYAEFCRKRGDRPGNMIFPDFGQGEISGGKENP